MPTKKTSGTGRPRAASTVGRKAASSKRSRPQEPTARLSSGVTVSLDGDLVFLIDALYRDFAVQHGFAPDYADLQRELAAIVDQMDPDTTHEYFSQSLFLNYVTYENEMADRLAEQLKAKARPKKARAK